MKNIEFLTVDELASVLKVKPSWIYRKVQERAIPFLKFGHYLRFDLDAVLSHFKASDKEV